MKKADLTAMFKDASMSNCISTIVLSPDTVTYSTNFFTQNYSRNHK